ASSYSPRWKRARPHSSDSLAAPVHAPMHGSARGACTKAAGFSPAGTTMPAGGSAGNPIGGGGTGASASTGGLSSGATTNGTRAARSGGGGVSGTGLAPARPKQG